MNLLKIFQRKVLLILLSIAVLTLLAFFVFSAKDTAPALNLKTPSQTQSFPTKFLVFGDSGVGNDVQKSLADLMKEKKADFLLHTGDVAYDRGSYQEVQRNVLDIYEDLFKESTFYPSMGNHDYLTEKGAPYISAFHPPDPQRYYSFTSDNALFISLDSNDSLDKEPNEMIPWLERVLKEKGKKIKWLVVYFHHPPYESGAYHKSDERVRKKIVPILEKYSVDVVFNGHEHNYQRSCPILKNKCEKEGVVYIVTGGGGAPLYDFGTPTWFTVKQVKIHHFLNVEVDSCKMKIEAINSNGNIFDEISLSKC